MTDDAPPGTGRSHPAVAAREGVPFRRTPERELTLDVYRPPTDGRGEADADDVGPGAGDASLPGPAFVYVHGGGWRDRNPDEYRDGLRRIAGRGYVCVNLTYRVSGEATYPAAVEDVAHGVGWTRALEGVDAGRVAVGGLSAGAHLATLVANAGERFAPSDAPASPDVAAAVGLSGVYDVASGMPTGAGTGDEPADGDGDDGKGVGTGTGVDDGSGTDTGTGVDDGKGVGTGTGTDADSVPGSEREEAGGDDAGPYAAFLGGRVDDVPGRYREASPAEYANAAPPTFLAHGTDDDVLPYANALAYRDRLRAAGRRVAFETVDGGGHLFPFEAPWFARTADRVAGFLDATL
jgi:acetyl esterase/lipase